MDVEETIPKEFWEILGRKRAPYSLWTNMEMTVCYTGEEEIGIPVLENIYLEGMF